MFLNNLTLANGTIRFHSSVTAIGMLLRMFAVLMGSSITCGLAYPWLKMWMISWIANNTHVQGDLDSLELTNDDKPQDSGPLMWISRGIMPYVPFI
ncbi:membrane protein YjgN [Escherichia coli]|nr:membrane protein YjgN [Escherichia coli]